MHRVGAHVLSAVFLLLLVSCQASVEGDAAGECADGADNDQDGMTDCDDDTCSFEFASAWTLPGGDAAWWSKSDANCLRPAPLAAPR